MLLLTTGRSHSSSQNHGSGKWLDLKGNYDWRDQFLTSMIMGGRGRVSTYQPFSLINLQVRIAMYDYSPAEGEEAVAMGASAAKLLSEFMKHGRF